MKEAIGGTWLYVIVLVFIALFTCFVSVTTNYSRCFKIKDEILQTIEIYHGINEKSVLQINTYLRGIGYSAEGDCPDDGTCWHGFSTAGVRVSGYGSKTNYCLAKHEVVGEGKGPIGHPASAYYSAVVFFQLNWPILKTFFIVPIYGETSIIYMPDDIDDVDNNKCT